MSNKSRGPQQNPQRPAGLKNLAEMLQKAAESRQQTQPVADDGADEADEATAAVSGNLAMPLSQGVGAHAIVWRWECCGEDVTVLGQFLLHDDDDFGATAGDYVVQLSINGISPGNYYVLGGIEAKEIADTLLSAYQWQFIWRQHAGDFLVKSLMEQPESEPEPELELLSDHWQLPSETYDES